MKLIKPVLTILMMVLSLVLYSRIANATDYSTATELSMKTDVGEVVLQVTTCKVQNKWGFAYEAYATEGNIKHKGCWYKDGDIINIWFYEEQPKLIATYKDYYFLPKVTI